MVVTAEVPNEHVEVTEEQKPAVERPHIVWWIAVLSGLGITAAIGFSDSVYQQWLAVFGGPPQWVFSSIFGAALAVHAAEATYAHRRADAGGEDPTGWWFQTLLLGYPSLRLLLAKTPPIKKNKAKQRKKRSADPRIHS